MPHSPCIRRHLRCLMMVGLLSIFNFQFSILYAQPLIQHLQINQGSANNHIRDLVQDEMGRLWIATESGLYYHDGYQFHLYNTGNSDLKSNMINCLCYDAQRHTIWVGTKGLGICRIDTRTAQLTQADTRGQKINNVVHITPDRQGGLWIVTPSQLYRQRPSDATFQPFGAANSHYSYRCALATPSGQLIVGNYLAGLTIFDPATTDRPSAHRMGRASVNCLYEDHRGQIWAGADNGLFLYHPSLEATNIETISPSAPIGQMEVNGLCEINKQQLWIATRTGVKILNLNNHSIVPYTSAPNVGVQGPKLVQAERSVNNPQTSGFNSQFSIFNSHNAQRIHQDAYGNIYIGYAGDGIDMISHVPSLFHQISTERTWCLLSNGGQQYWAGGQDKVMRFSGGAAPADLPHFLRKPHQSRALHDVPRPPTSAPRSLRATPSFRQNHGPHHRDAAERRHSRQRHHLL